LFAIASKNSKNYGRNKSDHKIVKRKKEICANKQPVTVTMCDNYIVKTDKTLRHPLKVNEDIPCRKGEDIVQLLLEILIK
jgi:hypothetical protein